MFSLSFLLLLHWFSLSLGAPDDGCMSVNANNKEIVASKVYGCIGDWTAGNFLTNTLCGNGYALCTTIADLDSLGLNTTAQCNDASLTEFLFVTAVPTSDVSTCADMASTSHSVMGCGNTAVTFQPPFEDLDNNGGLTNCGALTGRLSSANSDNPGQAWGGITSGNADSNTFAAITSTSSTNGGALCCVTTPTAAPSLEPSRVPSAAPHPAPTVAPSDSPVAAAIPFVPPALPVAVDGFLENYINLPLPLNVCFASQFDFSGAATTVTQSSQYTCSTATGTPSLTTYGNDTGVTCTPTPSIQSSNPASVDGDCDAQSNVPYALLNVYFHVNSVTTTVTGSSCTAADNTVYALAVPITANVCVWTKINHTPRYLKVACGQHTDNTTFTTTFTTYTTASNCSAGTNAVDTIALSVANTCSHFALALPRNFGSGISGLTASQQASLFIGYNAMSCDASRVYSQTYDGSANQQSLFFVVLFVVIAFLTQ